MLSIAVFAITVALLTGTPSFFFHTNCSLSSDEVRRRWNEGGEEAEESIVSLHIVMNATAVLSYWWCFL